MEEFIVVVPDLADWKANSSFPWDAHHAMMACHIVALYKCPGVHPVGIGETLSQDISKLVKRAAGDQANTDWGSLQLGAVKKSAMVDGNNYVR